jgi:hypothetical protein
MDLFIPIVVDWETLAKTRMVDSAAKKRSFPAVYCGMLSAKTVATAALIWLEGGRGFEALYGQS